jgi:hypothetical protein
MSMSRFVPINEIKDLMKQMDQIQGKIQSFGLEHCQKCGDTKPKHGFYPLLGGCYGPGIYQTSPMLCNRCGRTDDDYFKMFKEPKEIILDMNT